MNAPPLFIVIYGSTAVGKSAFALELAKYLPAEIINADVGQLYKPFSIGTAKPSWQEHPVPHHLFDVINKPVDFSSYHYCQMVEDVMTGIYQRGAIPLIVGGSGFYVRSLFFPPTKAQDVPSHKSAAAYTNDKSSLESSWEELAAIDPVRAKQLHPHDTYRIERALTVWKQSGTLPSQLKPTFKPIGNGIVIYLTRDEFDYTSSSDSTILSRSPNLKAIIKKRAIRMLEDGWLDEVHRLSHSEDYDWLSFAKKKGLIGYDCVERYLDHSSKNPKQRRVSTALSSDKLVYGEDKSELEGLAEEISRATWQYARRQRSFWRSLKRDLIAKNVDCREADLSYVDGHLYIKDLAHELWQMHSELPSDKIHGFTHHDSQRVSVSGTE